MNILGNIKTNNITCIITYINDNNEIKFLFYKINNLIQNNLKKEHSLNISKANPINKYINCQKELDSKLVCFYRNKDGFVQKIEFNSFFCISIYIIYIILIFIMIILLILLMILK